MSDFELWFTFSRSSSSFSGTVVPPPQKRHNTRALENVSTAFSREYPNVAADPVITEIANPAKNASIVQTMLTQLKTYAS